MSCVEEFQMVYVDTALRKEKHNSPRLKCGLCVVTSFQRVQRGQGEEKRVI